MYLRKSVMPARTALSRSYGCTQTLIAGCKPLCVSYIASRADPVVCSHQKLLGRSNCSRLITSISGAAAG